ncbi:hypothetical protein [Thermococcus chitonophagus]|uniref:Uncharacterized protein n=1 Tax=Thermococcus chitonophagus TaxID=54262 RepID=A0A170SKZ3_9EURY|nr:hypothetical protein [Thermococcus chitonophagus]CUX77908.1 hypothetical protein CHITON_1129 [Thermococcus chitonophagus]
MADREKEVSAKSKRKFERLLDEFVEVLKDVDEVSEAVRESFRRALNDEDIESFVR